MPTFGPPDEPQLILRISAEHIVGRALMHRRGMPDRTLTSVLSDVAVCSDAAECESLTARGIQPLDMPH